MDPRVELFAGSLPSGLLGLPPGTCRGHNPPQTNCEPKRNLQCPAGA